MALQPIRGTSSLKPVMWTATVVLIIAVSLASVAVIAIGMLPTVVSFVVDRTPKKYATFSVGAMNLCGIFPSLLQLWTGGNNFSLAMDIVTDPFSLVVMYSAAGFGWLIHTAMPPVYASFIEVVSQHRITDLRSTQRSLIQEWGAEIAATESSDDDESEDGEE